MTARVGLLGGTFNPPHIGHLVCAREARAQLDLDEVWLLPALEPPHKPVAAEPGPEERRAMCELAAREDGGLAVCALELELPAPSYSVATLQELNARRPGDELTFIVGGDNAAGFATWREPEAILGLARLGVAEREEHRRESISAALAEVPGAAERLSFFSMPRLDLSSSLIRDRVGAGESIRWLVPEGVARHIADRGLYRTDGGA